ncbi:P-loop NTPase, partial [Acinetobacter baumannii]
MEYGTARKAYHHHRYQKFALHDATKGIELFNKVGIPVLGVVENMST